MRDLLVSVRDIAEFEQAIAAKVQIIDFKEPNHGALAAVDPLVWHRASAIVVAWGGALMHPIGKLRSKHSLLSAALGESEDYGKIIDQLPQTFRFAKVGPSGIDCPKRLARLWRDAHHRLACRNAAAELVPVAYADHQLAGCVAPERIFQLAAELGFKRCLIDTFEKNGAGSLDLLSFDRFVRLQRIAEAANMKWSLAGSMRLESVDLLNSVGIHPDCFAVRGDVCDPDSKIGRRGKLNAARLKAWVEKVGLLSSPIQLG
ncbi:hypothetical protein CA13_71980 [Planctomycetes bacterium CA13]|uniref:(5-formylfuran-3-yl)methyl phosphate synthase n=1 Tax=Novipirellula herctigrandis TaxID=2527986 RepID=A0A5C5YNZ9_9BACT|nr:hypothetical protein CA13_71980 [Planctomycetes bacterium CA13]